MTNAGKYFLRRANSSCYKYPRGEHKIRRHEKFCSDTLRATACLCKLNLLLIAHKTRIIRRELYSGRLINQLKTHNPRWYTHISQLTQFMPPPETYKSETLHVWRNSVFWCSCFHAGTRVLTRIHLFMRDMQSIQHLNQKRSSRKGEAAEN